jgi:hypothetical protein
MRITNFIPLAILIAGYFLFTSSTCDTCDAIALADLTVETFEGELSDIGPDGEFIYSISAKILNILGIANGCEELDFNAPAGPNGFLEQVVFSANGTFNDAVIVDELITEISTLDPSEAAVVNDAFRIVRDGSFRFFTTVDVRDDVEERDEGNNEGNVTIKSISREVVVTGTRNVPMVDDNGKPIFIIRKSAPKVSYEF